MTRVWYGIQYLDGNGDWAWKHAFTGDTAKLDTPSRSLACLDRFRRRFPDDAWRVVTRTIPDWEPADEAALREGAAVAAAAAYAALAADPEEIAIEGALRARHRRLLHYNRSYVEGTIDVLDQPIGEDQ